jgi:hypothetical protein
VPAVFGAWEGKRFTVFVEPTVFDPSYREDEKAARLILSLEGLDTIVICAGHNPDILSYPPIKAFVERVRKERPHVRIVTQKCVIVG